MGKESSGPSGESRGRRAKAARFEVEQRLTEIEDRLLAGINPSRIESELSQPPKINKEGENVGGWGIVPRQVRKYITEIYRRWETEAKEDAPHRREKLIRMGERLFARAIGSGKYGAANGALNTLAKLGGAFARPAEAGRKSVVERLGPPPTNDPTKALIYAQQVLVLSIEDILSDSTMDPEKRYRLLGDLSAKVGMTHAKALVEDKLDRVTKRLLVAKDRSGGTESTHGVVLPATSRGGARRLGRQASGGPDASSASSKDAGGDSGGGRPVGPDRPKVH